MEAWIRMRGVRIEDAVRGVDRQQRRATSLCQIVLRDPRGLVCPHLESHLVEPMLIVIPPGRSGAPMRDGPAC